MDINALIDFQLVATHGGLGRASRASGRSKATLSRRIAELEDALGVRLIERGPRGLEMTEAGQLLLNRTENPMREIAEAFTDVKEGLDKPKGRLRIAAPLVFSQTALGMLSAKFQANFPEIQVEAVAEDRLVDLIEERFDVTIRISPRSDSALVGRCFAKDRLVLVAAPSIPAPGPRSKETVVVPAVVSSNYRDGDVWSVLDKKFVVEPQPALRLSSLIMVRDAVAAGAGAGLLPESIARELVAQGKLVIWGTVSQETELWVLHTSRRLQSPKVRAFVNFMCEQYPDGRFVI